MLHLLVDFKVVGYFPVSKFRRSISKPFTMKIDIKILFLVVFISGHSAWGQEKYKEYGYDPDGILFFDDFEHGNHYGWATGTNSNRKLEISNGRYVVEGKSSGHNPWIYLNKQQQYFTIDQTRNFQIELDLKLLSGSETRSNSLLFGQDKDGNNLRFSFSRNGKFLISKRENGGFINLQSWSVSNEIKKSDWNKLTVRKVKNNYYFFINEASFPLSDVV